MIRALPIAASLLALASASASAQSGPAAPPPAPAAAAPVSSAPTTPPRLTIVISVDQFSADLFAQYRGRFTDGLARLTQGAVFPAAYQAHAATETCPGHATILTGMHPANSGIVANSWVNLRAAREDKIVYCAEDETVPGSTHDSYTPSLTHLKVPTLGDLLKRAAPGARVVSVAGKDRAALMMGGRTADELWFWSGKGYATLAGRPMRPAIERANAAVAAMIAQPQAALPLPGFCRAVSRPIQAGPVTVGTGQFQRAAGDARAWRASPAADAAVLAIAAAFVQDMKLGRNATPDLLAIGLSATDYIGHTYGNQGSESCIQMAELDKALGAFFEVIDGTGIDYQVVLTADHGAHDLPERQRQQAVPAAVRMEPGLAAATIGREIGAKLGIAGPVLYGPEGDIYIAADVPAARRGAVIAETVRRYTAMPQVAAALTREQIMATPIATTPPETWTLAERARASFDPDRSGDILVMLRPRITAIPQPGPGYVATHGSPWDNDRRVPLLFWRAGMPGFEQPMSVMTVDIAPTLASLLGIAGARFDGRCLDLDPGPADTCR